MKDAIKEQKATAYRQMDFLAFLKRSLTTEEERITRKIAQGQEKLDNYPNIYDKLFDYFAFKTNEMPYGTAHARTGDPYEWITKELQNRLTENKNLKMKSLKEIIKEEIEAGSYGNPPPPSDSNWYEFAKEFDVGVLDLVPLAGILGYKSFKDMDMSISPKDLFKRNRKKFIDTLRFSSLLASDMTDEKIGNTILSLWP